MKLSVITINYNNRAGLEKTMESVIHQGFTDFEYIVIDGKSEDGSVDVIEKYKNHLAYWVSEKDKGIYHAQNKGILAAKGEYLLFLNSGDFLCGNDVLERVFSANPGEDIIYGNMRIDWGNNHVTEGTMPDKISVEHMFADTLWHPVSFIKRSLFDKFGLYNENYKIVADYDFFFKAIIAGGASTRHLAICISQYDTGGLSSKPGNKRHEQEERRKVQQTYLEQETIKRLEKKEKQKRSVWYRLLKKAGLTK